MNIKLMTDHDLGFLSLKGGCVGSSESTQVKMPHCWKYDVAAHFVFEISKYDTSIYTMDHPDSLPVVRKIPLV